MPLVITAAYESPQGARPLPRLTTVGAAPAAGWMPSLGFARWPASAGQSAPWRPSRAGWFSPSGAGRSVRFRYRRSRPRGRSDHLERPEQEARDRRERRLEVSWPKGRQGMFTRPVCGRARPHADIPSPAARSSLREQVPREDPLHRVVGADVNAIRIAYGSSRGIQACS